MKKQAYAQLKPHLAPDEFLLWCGRPAKRPRRFAWSYLPIGAILLFISGLWIVVFSAAVRQGGEHWVSACLVSVFFVFMWHGVLMEWISANRATYGVTDRRVLIVESGLRDHTKSIGYLRLQGVAFTGSRQFGTVRCARASMPWKNQKRPGRVASPALFRRIFDAGDVCDLILAQRASCVDVLEENARNFPSGAPDQEKRTSPRIPGS